jgi:hypothetical protein
MASRLSSLLVRDGLVGVRRMERAFQRQVIDGGGLDTILLELGLVTEERLTQYLALATGVPPATAEELRQSNAAAAAIVPRELAESTRAVPLALVPEGVRVLVCEPVEIPRLEELADAINLGIQPVIAAEFRWHLALARAYGRPAPARYSALGTQLDLDGPAPVGRARSVIVETMSPPLRPAEPPTPAEPSAGSSLERALAGAIEAASVIAPVEQDAPTARLTSEPPAPPPSPPAIGEPAPPVRASGLMPARAPLATEWATGEPTDPRGTAIALGLVRDRLRSATTRDEIWDALLDGVRTRAAWAGIFTIQGGVATGRRAAAEVGLDVAAVTSLALPVAALPPLQRAVASAQVHFAALATGDAGLDAQLALMGGDLGAPMMLLPLRLGVRVPLVVIAHGHGAPLGLAEAAEVLPLAEMAADALGRLIAAQKASAAPVTAPAPAPAATTAPPPIPPLTPEAAAVLLDEIEAGNDDALDDALDNPPGLLEAVARRFPGKLRTTRYQASRPLRAGQHGNLLELLVQLGPPAVPLLLGKLGDADRDVRYYATTCLAELRPAGAVDALIDRTFDSDFAVRALALDALGGYPRREVAPALATLRQAIGHDDDARARAAMAAVAELVDVDAIPELLDALDGDERRAEAARRALTQLTRHDLGTSSKKWRAWWQDHRDHHRLEWLIAALAHKDDALRVAAFDELRRLTGESNGYAEDLGRKERDAAVAAWQRWWDEVGRQRFA